MSVSIPSLLFTLIMFYLWTMFQDLTYLSAVLAIKRNKGPEKALELLNSAIETHFKSLKVFKVFPASVVC